MFTKVIDGKKVIVKGKAQNVPPLKVVKDVYAKIPDNKRIPLVFETKEQYLDEYIKNQEKKKNIRFKPTQIQSYKAKELSNMQNIISRYTTDHNPFIDRRTVFFTDRKIPVQQFKDSAVHEYGHELWEKNPKIRKDWKSVSNSTSPTPYGKTAKQEDFAESYMLHSKGQLFDSRRNNIIRKDVTARNNVLPWHGNIESQTINNPNYRKVIETGGHAQLVLMSLKPKQEIGNEVHPKVDQFFRVEQGKAKFSINNGKVQYVEGNGGAAFIPAGTWHNVTNTSPNKALKLYTLYSPPNHPPGTIQKDRPSKDDLLDDGYIGGMGVLNEVGGGMYPPEVTFSKQWKTFGLPKSYVPNDEVNNLGTKVFMTAHDKAITPENISRISTTGINIPSFKAAILADPKSLNMALIKQTTVPVIDYPEDYHTVKEKVTTKMPPEKVFDTLQNLYAEEDKEHGRPVSHYNTREDFIKHLVSEGRVKKDMERLKNDDDVPTGYIEVSRVDGKLSVGYDMLHGIEAARRLGADEVPIVLVKGRGMTHRPGSFYGDWEFTPSEMKKRKEIEDQTTATIEKSEDSENVYHIKTKGPKEDWKEVVVIDKIPKEFNPKKPIAELE